MAQIRTVGNTFCSPPLTPPWTRGAEILNLKLGSLENPNVNSSFGHVEPCLLLFHKHQASRLLLGIFFFFKSLLEMRG